MKVFRNIFAFLIGTALLIPVSSHAATYYYQSQEAALSTAQWDFEHRGMDQWPGDKTCVPYDIILTGGIYYVRKTHCNRYNYDQIFGYEGYGWIEPYRAVFEPQSFMSGDCGSCMVSKDGNPVNSRTGNKFQQENDYQHSNGLLAIQRSYNSYNDTNSGMGYGWSHNYQSRIVKTMRITPSQLDLASSAIVSPDGYAAEKDGCLKGGASLASDIHVKAPEKVALSYSTSGGCRASVSGAFHTTLRLVGGKSDEMYVGQNYIIALNYVSHDGDVTQFIKRDDEWVSPQNPELVLSEIALGYVVKKKQGVVEHFDSEGLIQSRANPNGQSVSMIYDANNRISHVDDSFGNVLHFTYTEEGAIESITTPDSNAIIYVYDALNNLVKAKYRDAAGVTRHTRRYLYGDVSFPHHLTGIIDENDNRFASWEYDGIGRAVSSEHAGGVERVDFQYNKDGSSTVTNSAGMRKTYTYDVINGKHKVMNVTFD